MRVKGVVVEKHGTRLIIECDHAKHWKLQSIRSNEMMYEKGHKAPEPFDPKTMPKEKTIVRIIWR